MRSQDDSASSLLWVAIESNRWPFPQLNGSESSMRRMRTAALALLVLGTISVQACSRVTIKIGPFSTGTKSQCTGWTTFTYRAV